MNRSNMVIKLVIVGSIARVWDMLGNAYSLVKFVSPRKRYSFFLYIHIYICCSLNAKLRHHYIAISLHFILFQDYVMFNNTMINYYRTGWNSKGQRSWALRGLCWIFWILKYINSPTQCILSWHRFSNIEGIDKKYIMYWN